MMRSAHAVPNKWSRHVLAKRVDGLIVSPAKESDVEHLKEASGSIGPLALLDRGIEALNVDTVMADDWNAAAEITRSLITIGHRRIAYLTACDNAEHVFRKPADVNTGSVRRRIEGFLDTCLDAGLQGMEHCVHLGAATPADARRITQQILTERQRPTAIIASDSVVGLEVFKTSRVLGLAIPGDLSLVSFHDADWTTVTTPPVTVIRQPVYRLGEMAARFLIERLNGLDEPPRTLVLPNEIVERLSVAGPATAADA